MVTQSLSLSKNPNIIIGTPGRLADHIANTKGVLKSIKKNLQYLVFD